MAGKAIIPFNEASSTFTLEGEPSSANLALAVMEDDQEAEHIAKTPLAVLPASAPKGEMGGTDKGAGRTPSLAEPCRRPLGLLFYATHHQEDLRQECARVQEILHVQRWGCSHRRTSPSASLPIRFHQCR